jgi:hypothetical protein
MSFSLRPSDTVVPISSNGKLDRGVGIAAVCHRHNEILPWSSKSAIAKNVWASFRSMCSTGAVLSRASPPGLHPIHPFFSPSKSLLIPKMCFCNGQLIPGNPHQFCDKTFPALFAIIS